MIFTGSLTGGGTNRKVQLEMILWDADSKQLLGSRPWGQVDELNGPMVQIGHVGMILQVQVEASLTRGPFVLGTSRGKGEKADIPSNFFNFIFLHSKQMVLNKQKICQTDEMRSNRKIENDSTSFNRSTYPPS